MDDLNSAPVIPDDLYRHVRDWIAYYVPMHRDQTARLGELWYALVTGQVEQTIVTMVTLADMARYYWEESPRRNDVVRRAGLILIPELVDVATRAGRWCESDQRDADCALRASARWVSEQRAKDRALAAGVEVA